MNNTFKLGRSITQIIPFYRQRQEKEIITNKLVLSRRRILCFKSFNIWE